MTLDFVSLIPHGWVMAFQDSNGMVFIFRIWLDLIGVVLAFWISILKISKFQNCWHRVIDITSFDKHVENSEFLSQFGNISFQEYLSKGISHPVFYDDLVYKYKETTIQMYT